MDSEIARIDIDDSDAMPKAWKLQGFDNQNVKSGLMNSHQIENTFVQGYDNKEIIKE